MLTADRAAYSARFAQCGLNAPRCGYVMVVADLAVT